MAGVIFCLRAMASRESVLSTALACTRARACRRHTLDELPTGKTVEHLRSILIAAGICHCRGNPAHP
jgi:hypothetical protein